MQWSLKEYLFNKAFSERGGLLHISQLPDDTSKELILNTKRMAIDTVTYLKHRYPNLPEVYIDIINSNTMNASACKYNGDYYLGINIGLYLIIADMFFKMFATRTILPMLGNASLETDDKKTLNILIEDSSIAFDYNIANLAVPKDSVRYNYAKSYITLALLFLINHELGHIIRGHTGYIASKYNEDVWTEYQWKPKWQRDPAVSQTLEMDADSFATNHAFIIAKFYADNQHFSSEEFKLVYSDLATFFSHWYFAIYSLFRVAGFNKLNLEEAKKLQHPPALVRVYMVASNITSILLHNKIEGWENILGIAVKSGRQVEHAILEITFQQSQAEIYTESLSGVREYMNEILANWNHAYALIKPYSYGDLPPLK